MGARSQMVDALTEKLSGSKVRIVPDPRKAGDVLTKKLDMMLQVVLVSLQPTATTGQVRADFELWVVVPYQDPESGEEPLEQALDDVLDALFTIPWWGFEKAERSVFGESWLAYKVTGFSQLTMEE